MAATSSGFPALQIVFGPPNQTGVLTQSCELYLFSLRHVLAAVGHYTDQGMPLSLSSPVVNINLITKVEHTASGLNTFKCPACQVAHCLPLVL